MAECSPDIHKALGLITSTTQYQAQFHRCLNPGLVKARGSQAADYSRLHNHFKANTGSMRIYFFKKKPKQGSNKNCLSVSFWVSLSFTPSSDRVPRRQGWPWTVCIAELTLNFWSSSQEFEFQATFVFWSSALSFWNFLQHMQVQMNLFQEPDFKCGIDSQYNKWAEQKKYVNIC